ncbi:hypothetical protein PSD17_18560 [Pseudonocardia sp. D17]|nr:hypothetical protein PSD17_18560 [Pseudonocardia sp. D17]
MAGGADLVRSDRSDGRRRTARRQHVRLARTGRRTRAVKKLSRVVDRITDADKEPVIRGRGGGPAADGEVRLAPECCTTRALRRKVASVVLLEERKVDNRAIACGVRSVGSDVDPLGSTRHSRAHGELLRRPASARRMCAAQQAGGG